MFYPTSWNEQEQIFPSLGPDQGHHGLEYPLPDVFCDGSQGVKCSNSIFKGRKTDWFTNYTYVSTPTLPDDMYDGENERPKKKFNPWGSPGKAPIYGEGCGANGGNPNGCNGHEADSNPYGTCCSGGMRVEVIQI